MFNRVGNAPRWLARSWLREKPEGLREPGSHEPSYEGPGQENKAARPKAGLLRRIPNPRTSVAVVLPSAGWPKVYWEQLETATVWFDVFRLVIASDRSDSESEQISSGDRIP